MGKKNCIITSLVMLILKFKDYISSLKLKCPYICIEICYFANSWHTVTLSQTCTDKTKVNLDKGRISICCLHDRYAQCSSVLPWSGPLVSHHQLSTVELWGGAFWDLEFTQYRRKQVSLFIRLDRNLRLVNKQRWQPPGGPDCLLHFS